MAFLKSKDEKLFKAVEGGDSERVRKLLENGASVDATTSDGSSQPLHQACTQGLADIATVLLDNGADVNKRTESDLAVAISSGLMKHLTDGTSSGATGALLGGSDGREGGSTPLMFAVLSCNVDLIKLLLAHPQIDINARNNAGATALSVSQNGVQPAHKEITELLEGAGALDLEVTVTSADQWGGEGAGTAMPTFAQDDENAEDGEDVEDDGDAEDDDDGDAGESAEDDGDAEDGEDDGDAEDGEDGGSAEDDGAGENAEDGGDGGSEADAEEGENAEDDGDGESDDAAGDDEDGADADEDGDGNEGAIH